MPGKNKEQYQTQKCGYKLIAALFDQEGYRKDDGIVPYSDIHGEIAEKAEKEPFKVIGDSEC